jgi:predicted RND superfamily exporter protein
VRRYFEFITSHPRSVLAASTLLALALVPWLFTLTRDTSPDAFIPEDHQALILKRQVEQMFGLAEPIAVGIIRDRPGGVFNADTLRLIQTLTRTIQQIPGVAPDDVVSLATESGVYFKGREPEFDRLLKHIPQTPGELQALKADVLGYELYRGTIVSADGSAACVLIRPRSESQADAVYRILAARLPDFPIRDERLVVAGEAAVRAHMGSAVSDDALRMNFICPVVMAVVIALTYRNVRGTILPLAVVGGASALTLDLMGACRVPVYIVTNGIFVVIMALGVADSLHLLGQYYEEQLDPRGRGKQQLIVDACRTLWLPVLITSLTDIAGFLALYVTGTMPPIRYFGLFTSVGVAGALLYSCTVVPAGLMLCPLRMSPVFLRRRMAAVEQGPDRLGRALGWLGAAVFRRRRRVLLAGAVLLTIAGWGASKLVVNDARILAFKDQHPIAQAAKVLNERFDGTSHLNILVSASQPGALLRPEVLRRIDELEAYTETLPQVGGTHSLAGWVKRAHQKMHDEDPAYYAIPDDPSDTRFYLDVLIADASPMARSLREIVDPTYTKTNLIVRLRSSQFIHQRAVVHALQQYLARHFGDGLLRAQLAGRAYLDYHWLRLVGRTQVRNVALSCMSVLLLTGLMFRSLAGGLLCMLTAGVSVLVNYAIMGFGGIPLGVGTSMFASIAIGTGVNFPIVMLDRLRTTLSNPPADPADVFRGALAFSGRAMFFTAAVVAIGFLLLCVSEFRTLNEFGLLIGSAMLVSFAASITLLPAAVVAWKPRFVWGQPPGAARPSPS